LRFVEGSDKRIIHICVGHYLANQQINNIEAEYFGTSRPTTNGKWLWRNTGGG